MIECKYFRLQDAACVLQVAPKVGLFKRDPRCILLVPQADIRVEVTCKFKEGKTYNTKDFSHLIYR